MMIRKKYTLALLLLTMQVAAVTQAQDIGEPDPETLRALYPGKAYSPYAKRSFPNNIYWGESYCQIWCLAI